MRRSALLGGVVGVILLLGTNGVAGAATLHVKPGQKWTAEEIGGNCAIETIGTGHTLTVDIVGPGTYAGGGKHITESYGDGEFAFSGTWSNVPQTTKKGYVGTFTGPSASLSGYLVKGVVSSWNGYTC